MCGAHACFSARVHLIPNWSVLAKAPVRDPSAPQEQGPSAAASPAQMDLTAGDSPCKPPGPPPTDGVSQWECRYTSIPIKAWPATEVTFWCCVSLGQRGREFSLGVCFSDGWMSLLCYINLFCVESCDSEHACQKQKMISLIIHKPDTAASVTRKHSSKKNGIHYISLKYMFKTVFFTL